MVSPQSVLEEEVCVCHVEVAIREVVHSLEERSVAVAYCSMLKVVQKNFPTDLDGNMIQSPTTTIVPTTRS